MQTENSLHPESLEPRGALCVECLVGIDATQQVHDRTGAALCRACAAKFYTACAGCGGLVPTDEALARPDTGALNCFECFGRPASDDGTEALSDEEVAALVAEYVALHEELKRLDARASEVKEQLKRASSARPRVSNAVVLRADEAGVRCSYTSKATYDAERLAAAEALLGAENFATLFERKVTFSAVKARLEEFLSSEEAATATAREAVRAAETRTEVATLTVVAQRKKKSS
ncbi:MAG: hypothetical protein QOH49_192 [Acidobacteriota bacterium]|jgi:hypothetical protein|nr:hypothetical protein [Acidobacteriota bacterium]